MKRTFKNFSIEANFEIPVTLDNFFKHSVKIEDSKGLTVEVIRKEELTYNLVQDLVTGDENSVKNVIIYIIHLRELRIKELKKLLYV